MKHFKHTVSYFDNFLLGEPHDFNHDLMMLNDDDFLTCFRRVQKFFFNLDYECVGLYEDDYSVCIYYKKETEKGTSIGISIKID